MNPETISTRAKKAKHTPYNAKLTYHYFIIYKKWLRENELSDDSAIISVPDLHRYINEGIPAEDVSRLWNAL